MVSLTPVILQDAPRELRTDYLIDKAHGGPATVSWDLLELVLEVALALPQIFPMILGS